MQESGAHLAGTSLMEKYGVSPEMAKVVPPGRQFHSLKLNYQKLRDSWESFFVFFNVWVL